MVARVSYPLAALGSPQHITSRVMKVLQQQGLPVARHGLAALRAVEELVGRVPPDRSFEGSQPCINLLHLRLWHSGEEASLVSLKQVSLRRGQLCDVRSVHAQLQAPAGFI